ncbi:hypothetical protein [Ensifer aridi]|uniref:hypothetical protein n=1 Tax=Ensifer aridi TaxID=1708715 RepID=UPI0009BE8EC9|nr:hypothetical protein [Ensifer aridi]
MANGIDLATFKPESASDLLTGMLKQIASIVLGNFNEIKKELSVHLKSLAQKAWMTQVGLATGAISRENADVAIHTQELALSNVVLYSEFMVYDTAQKVLSAVFSVIGAAIKNLTGVELNFG